MNLLARNKKVVFSFVVLTLLALAACGNSKMQGTYSSNKFAPVVLELRSGGKASLTIMGRSVACTYQVDGKTLDLTLDRTGVTYHFEILDDGSLSEKGDPGLWGVLRKSKT